MIIIVLKYSEVPYDVSEFESLKTIQTYFSFLLQSFVLVDYSMSELCVCTQSKTQHTKFVFYYHVCVWQKECSNEWPERLETITTFIFIIIILKFTDYNGLRLVIRNKKVHHDNLRYWIGSQ